MKPKLDPKFGGPLPLGPSVVTGRDTPETREPLAAGVPLAKLIKRTLLAEPEVVMLSDPRSIGAERFRRLRTVLVSQQRDRAQVIVVTSGGPEEGKSTVAVNLALAFATDGNESTLLVDADLRRPTVASWLRPAPQLGLTEILGGRTTVEHTILDLANSPLKVLPAGGSVTNPMELLSSDTARALFDDLRKGFARIIVDTPPIVPFTDADAVGALSDGVLLVARSGKTPTALYQQAVQSVTAARILGSVLNGADGSLADTKQYYDQYYDRYAQGERGK